jgi:amidophosphoribosyltransferase
MCGIIGIYNHNSAAELAMLGLFAQQHRGQESCGIAISDGKSINSLTGMGLVKDIFTPTVLKSMPGHIAIGHVRYPTRGACSLKNSQPHVQETLFGPSYALASNGDVLNYEKIKEQLQAKHVFFKSDNDGELQLKYLVYAIEQEHLTPIQAITQLLQAIKGAYSSVFATKSDLYLFRDIHAIRPMSYGKLQDGSFAVASESVALDILKPEWKKEVPPGAIIHFFNNQELEYSVNSTIDESITFKKHCIFEHIYFSRPDSFLFGENVYSIRKKIGALLANDNTEVDIAVPVPDSSNFIALGYAHAKNVPYEMGLIRNHYVGRTFIKPEQTIRDESVGQKFNALPNFFSGKRVALIDDSIVRGTTLRKIVKMVRFAGAEEIHLRIGSPPVKFSCFYGIDTPTQEELIANKKDIAEICEFIGADSLQFLSLEKLDCCVKEPVKYCKACFNGDYPVK